MEWNQENDKEEREEDLRVDLPTAAQERFSAPSQLEIFEIGVRVWRIHLIAYSYDIELNER